LREGGGAKKLVDSGRGMEKTRRRQKPEYEEVRGGKGDRVVEAVSQEFQFSREGSETGEGREGNLGRRAKPR